MSRFSYLGWRDTEGVIETDSEGVIETKIQKTTKITDLYFIFFLLLLTLCRLIVRGANQSYLRTDNGSPLRSVLREPGPRSADTRCRYLPELGAWEMDTALSHGSSAAPPHAWAEDCPLRSARVRFFFGENLQMLLSKEYSPTAVFFSAFNVIL